jgi:phosphatidylinositol alpha-1,6-mannosyltransferase
MKKPIMKPKILLVTRNFPPLVGGMERLMQEAAQGISEYADLTIVGPSGCKAYCPVTARAHEAPPGLVLFLLLACWHAAKACRKDQFTLLVGGSGLVAPVLLLLKAIFGGKTVVFVHGLDLVVQSFIYQKLFVRSISMADHLIANSRNTLKIAVRKGIPEQHITVVNPGTRLPELAETEASKEFLQRKGIVFEKVIIFVGRITRRKGLLKFIQHSLPTILKEEPESGLIVVGENPNQGLTNFGEAREVAELVSRLRLADRVAFLGKLDDEDLDACYSAADVQIFPLTHIPGDVEGFGMVAIEAAACGTPTVAFDVGGVSDAICAENGTLVEPGRYDLFSRAVTQIFREGKPDILQCRDYARKFSWNQYNENVRSVIDSMEI